MLNLARQRLLIVAPHPDDEVIGAGGLIRRVKDEGGKVYVLFLTVGDTDDFAKNGPSSRSQREKEIEEVAKYLKFDDYHIALSGNDFHLKLDTVGQKTLMHIIERESPVSLERIKPTIVAFPLATSYNQDHRIAAAATHAALRPSTKDVKHAVQTVLSFEETADLWSLENKPMPNFFVTLTQQQLAAKLHAVKLYASQLRDFPNLRSIEILKSLSKLRGGQAGVEAAEAFVLHRTNI